MRVAFGNGERVSMLERLKKIIKRDNQEDQEEQEKRSIGRYIVSEFTARRFVAEARGRPWVTVGIMWIGLLIVSALIAPWRGGARLIVALAGGGVLVITSLLVVYFSPISHRITVDVETAMCQVEHTFLLPPRTKTVEIPLPAVCNMRLRPRVWRDPGNASKIEWVAEVLGEEGEVWRLAEGDEREPMAELSRLAAEVAGCPMEETE
jgi:hypothetical protein